MVTKEALNQLLDRTAELKAQAVQEGKDLAPAGTYTFTNNDAAVVSLTLGAVNHIINGNDMVGLGLLSAAFVGREKEVSEILGRIADEITTKQWP